MSTHVEPRPRMPLVASALLGRLAENWWLLLLRGLAAIAFGVIAFFWPGITLVALTYLWGAYAVADGIIAIGAAFSASGGDAGPRWWLGLSGAVFAGYLAESAEADSRRYWYLVGAASAGLATLVKGPVGFLVPALVLLMFIAVWAIIIGVLQLYAAIRLWNVIDNDWWLILSGLLSIAFGAVLIAWPGTGALAVIWTIAWFAVFFGCMFIGLAFELKKFKRT